MDARNWTTCRARGRPAAGRHADPPRQTAG